jgi:hypothetical protein
MAAARRAGRRQWYLIAVRLQEGPAHYQLVFVALRFTPCKSRTRWWSLTWPALDGVLVPYYLKMAQRNLQSVPQSSWQISMKSYV